MEWLYNKKGQAKLFKYGDRFISCKGKNLAWIYSENVYNIRTGKHIGWYEKGVLYDRNNNVIAFTEDCKGYLPYYPGLGGVPGTPGIPGTPSRPGFGGIPGRPGYGGWSNCDIEDYFEL